MSELERGLANLRHLYAQMVTGLVRPSEHDIANAARGLLAPAITCIEQAQRRLAELEEENENLRCEVIEAHERYD